MLRAAPYFSNSTSKMYDHYSMETHGRGPPAGGLISQGLTLLEVIHKLVRRSTQKTNKRKHISNLKKMAYGKYPSPRGSSVLIFADLFEMMPPRGRQLNADQWR